MRIAIIGGTGAVGRHVVCALQERGHVAVAASRATGVDVMTGTGLALTLKGADAVVDLTNRVVFRSRAAVSHTEVATRNLLAAARAAHVPHVVALSIVGCHRTPTSYYLAKQRQEELLLESDVPTSLVRSTQFFEFTDHFVNAARGPLCLVPRAKVQPVAAHVVASHLVEVIEGGPTSWVPQIVGPEVHDLPDLVRRRTEARGFRRRVLPVALPGEGGAAMMAGTLLPRSDDTDVLRSDFTFEMWLAQNRADPA